MLFSKCILQKDKPLREGSGLGMLGENLDDVSYKLNRSPAQAPAGQPGRRLLQIPVL